MPVLEMPVRGILVLIAAGLIVVFGIAAWLRPYQEDGSARRLETHTQLGLPPCTFKWLTRGVPCPACGMTTSFALLIHGDVGNSLQANWVGTLLALFWLAMIPWSLACAVTGRSLFVRSMEAALMRVVLVFLSLMLFRWAVVVGLMWWRGRQA